MTGIISFLIVLFLSLLVVRIAGIVLTVTGMPREVARFEARSAWSGTGFTTTQSEQVIRHPVRRKILTTLILLRNAGLVGVASTLFLSVANLREGEGGTLKIALLLTSLCLIWLIARSQWVDRVVSNATARLLTRFTDIKSHDRAVLMHLGGDFTVQELSVTEDSWHCHKKVSELDLSKEGVLILGIDRKNNDFLGVPSGDIKVEPGDNIMVYGRSSAIQKLDTRQAGTSGDSQRRQAEQEHEQEEEQQKEEAKQSQND